MVALLSTQRYIGGTFGMVVEILSGHSCRAELQTCGTVTGPTLTRTKFLENLKAIVDGSACVD